jgi:hypothetical protein
MPRTSSSGFLILRASSSVPGTCGPNRTKTRAHSSSDHRIAAVIAPRKLCYLVTPEPTEAFDEPRQVETGVRRLEHQCRGVAGVARRVEHCDEAAHRVAVDDRPGDAEGVAERTDIVGTQLEAPGCRIAPFGAAMSS